MKKQLLICLSFIILAGAARAQTSFAPELGLNMCHYRFNAAGAPVTNKLTYGLRIGGIADIGLDKNWSVQPGIYYVMNGVNLDLVAPPLFDANLTLKINTIEIPVNVMYKFGTPGGNRFFVGAGPYMGINLGGTETSSFAGLSYSQSLSVGDDSTSSIRRMDFGMGLNVGYELISGLFFRARYQMGFSNLAPGGDANNYLRSSSFGVSIGYMFHSKSAKKGAKKSGK